MIQIKDKYDCCGCTACVSICGKKAIKMQSDEEGFLYPNFDLSLCINCKLCEQVCPIIERDKNCSNYKNEKKVFAIRHKDNKILYNSSSGGAFTAISDYVLNTNGVIFGAEYNEKLVVIHHKETTKEGVLKFRGSKYVQSNICDIYKEIHSLLRAGTLVLFSGTPCQVEGLKLFLRKPYNNLITVDILCHGVASPMVFADYIKFIKKYSIGHLKGIFMKDKTFGWGYQNTRLYFKEGSSEFNSPLSLLWNKLYYDHICNRPSCHKCRFTNLSRPGDISLGDYWGIEKYHKDFYSPFGVSLLMINTQKGYELWKNIKDRFDYIKSDTNKCMQPVLKLSKPESPDRELFWNEYKKKGFNKVVRQRYKITFSAILKNNLRQIINILRQR